MLFFLKNGDNVLFEYDLNGTPTPSSEPAKVEEIEASVGSEGLLPEDKTSSKRKKNKKKKKSSFAVPGTDQATINNPEEDYPTSRVIKQAPNGDIIVESLDDSNPATNHDDCHDHHNHHHHHEHPHHHPHLESQRDESQRLVHKFIWDDSTASEQQNLKEFWELLPVEEKKALVTIDKKAVMELFKSNWANHQHTPLNDGSVNGCPCMYCGRKKNVIDDELVHILDEQFGDIIDYIHEIRDINDLNALPTLLFGGFHMLEEEYKVQKIQKQLRKERERKETPELEKQVLHKIDEASPEYTHNIQKPSNRDFETVNAAEIINKEPQIHLQESTHSVETIDQTVTEEDSHLTNHYSQIEELGNEAEAAEFQDALHQYLKEDYDKIMTPNLIEIFDKLNWDINMRNPKDVIERAESFRNFIFALQKTDKSQLERVFTLGELLTGNNGSKEENQNLDETMSNGLSKFADDILKNNGNSFLSMIESLTEIRSEREQKLSKVPTNDDAWVDEDDKHALPENNEIADIDSNQADVHYETSQDEQDDYEEEDYEDYDEEEGEYEEDDEAHDDEDEDEEYEDDHEEREDELDDHSDVESEISEEEKLQEVRRMFLIQTIKVFQDRLKEAYKVKLSADRAQSLIKELEAEENAKKEKELKKLKQKEKAKEKKRLQQLAKEEERKKKEEEQKAKEEEARKKQEILREQQRQRKEEQRKKKEEEKKKRIEELKRKEKEHRKRVEAQQKKEEEAKKLKEERRKKIEEERLKREEEKLQKELLKKKKEQELQREREEQERLKQEEQARLELEKLELERLDRERQEMERLARLAVPTASLSNMEPNPFQPELPTLSISPNKNHLLEQLYQSKPRSSSQSSPSVSSFMNPINAVPSPATNTVGTMGSRTALNGGVVPGTQPSTASLFLPETNDFLLNSGSNMLSNNLIGTLNDPWLTATPNSSSGNNFIRTESNASMLSNDLMPGTGSSDRLPIGGSGATTNSNGILFSNGQFQTSHGAVHGNVNIPGGVNFSPFNDNAGSGFNTQGATWSPIPASRSNSIWANSMGPNNGGAVNVGGNNTSHLWGNTGSGSISNSLKATPVMQPASLTGTNISTASNISPVAHAPVAGNDMELIQTSTFTAYQMLMNANELEFGMAPLHKLFKTTKSLMGVSSITLNQFLGCCRAARNYGFDFVYDDFGTVTHIKVGRFTNGTPSPPPPPSQAASHEQVKQQQQQQQPMGVMGGVPPGFSFTNLKLGTPEDPDPNTSNLEGLNRLANSTVRGLWN